MKKLFTFLASALFAMTAAANGEVTDGWLMVEDFENASTPALYNKNGQNPTGTVNITDSPTETGNKVVSFENGDYNTAIELDVTLPDGKTLADYTQVAFDLYIVRHETDTYCNCKNMLVQIDDEVINLETNSPKQAEIEVWTQKTYNINIEQTAANTFKLRLGLLIKGGHYYIDNVRFKEYEEPGETSNGTVSGGWLMLEDFEAAQTVNTFNYKGYNPTGTASITANPTAAGERVASFVGGDFNTVIELDITLPDGKTLKDYTQIAFDIYLNANEAENFQYKQMLVWADDYVIHQDQDTDYPKVADPETWTTKSYIIDTDGNNIGNTFKLRIGVLDNAADYLIDNVRLKEYEEPGTSHNGEIVDGWLILQDFEAATAGEIGAWDIGGYGIPEETTTEIISNPTAGNERVAWFAGGNKYNTILELSVALPTDKKLSDYSDIAFDFYRNESFTNNYPMLYIRANDIVIYDDGESGNNYGSSETWSEVSKSLVGIEGLDGISGTFNLRLGMKTDTQDYLIDNVRLKPNTSSGITDVTAEGTAIVVGNGCVTITADDETAVAIYTAEGQLVARETVYGSTTISLARGLYIVNAGTQVRKVLVK